MRSTWSIRLPSKPGERPQGVNPVDVDDRGVTTEVINAAILPEFGGSNLGVPAARARELLSAVRQLP